MWNSGVNISARRTLNSWKTSCSGSSIRLKERLQPLEKYRTEINFVRREPLLGIKQRSHQFNLRSRGTFLMSFTLLSSSVMDSEFFRGVLADIFLNPYRL